LLPKTSKCFTLSVLFFILTPSIWKWHLD
jgi:hypothetical protein